MPQYKLAIADKVHVPIKIDVNNGGKNKHFSFLLVADRLPQDEIKERTKNPDMPVSEFVKSVVTGWQGQTLVVDEDDKPAEFSAETFDVMLGLPGFGLVAYKAYFEECGAKSKN
jgi:hypothetical protein